MMLAINFDEQLYETFFKKEEILKLKKKKETIEIRAKKIKIKNKT